MIKLYGHELSGNCYKVQLLLSLLAVEYQYVRVDLLNGEHNSPEFMKLNPFKQVPVLVDDDFVLQDAQAILVYLARRYGNKQWLPAEAELESRVMRWLFVAASEIRQGPESARLFYLLNVESINIEVARQKSMFILDRIEQHLTEREWLELGHPTIADIAVFPYVALVSDGKISLDKYSQVRAWIGRIRGLPNFVGMPNIEATASAC